MAAMNTMKFFEAIVPRLINWSETCVFIILPAFPFVERSFECAEAKGTYRDGKDSVNLSKLFSFTHIKSIILHPHKYLCPK